MLYSVLKPGLLYILWRGNSSHFFVRNSPKISPPHPCIAFLFVQKLLAT